MSRRLPRRNHALKNGDNIGGGGLRFERVCVDDAPREVVDEHQHNAGET